MDLFPSWMFTLKSGSPVTVSEGNNSKIRLGRNSSIVADLGSLFLISVKLDLSLLVGMLLFLFDDVAFLLGVVLVLGVVLDVGLLTGS